MPQTSRAYLPVIHALDTILLQAKWKRIQWTSVMHPPRSPVLAENLGEVIQNSRGLQDTSEWMLTRTTIFPEIRTWRTLAVDRNPTLHYSFEHCNGEFWHLQVMRVSHVEAIIFGESIPLRKESRGGSPIISRHINATHSTPAMRKQSMLVKSTPSCRLWKAEEGKMTQGLGTWGPGSGHGLRNGSCFAGHLRV